MEKVLFAADELTGLVGAAALMRPSKSVQDMELSSLKKKFKDKKFAAGCSRDVIRQGAERLGWELDRLLDSHAAGHAGLPRMILRHRWPLCKPFLADIRSRPTNQMKSSKAPRHFPAGAPAYFPPAPSARASAVQRLLNDAVHDVPRQCAFHIAKHIALPVDHKRCGKGPHTVCREHLAVVSIATG